MIFLTRSLMLLCFVFLFSCQKKESTPKPLGWIRLSYPKPIYKDFQAHSHFYFPYNTYFKLDTIKQKKGIYTFHNPHLKADIYLTYKPINKNLPELLQDIEKITYAHTIKASGITEYPFKNPKAKTFGMLYYLEGPAASNLQFYLTDSSKHMLNGAVYFYARPNYDSLKPAIQYIERDLRHLMNGFSWKT